MTSHDNVTDIVEPTIEQKLIVAHDPWASRIKFLEDAARHFEHQPTNGEDRAHWANVYNAKNCREIATDLATLRKQLENARSEALEEAACIADKETTTNRKERKDREGVNMDHDDTHSHYLWSEQTADAIAKGIRALKGQPC